jgi:hypothetical protein
MTENHRSSLGCTEEFSELCALSATSALTIQERRRLEEHVRRCPRCAAFLSSYRGVVNEQMARIAAVRDSIEPESYPRISWDREGAKARILAGLAQPPVKPRGPEMAGLWSARYLLPIAALLLIAVASSAYQFGIRAGLQRAASPPSSVNNNEEPLRGAAEESLRRQLASAQAERTALEQKAASDSQREATLKERAAKAEKDVAQLESAKASVEVKAEELGAHNAQQSVALAALTGERASLQQKLQDATSTLLKTSSSLRLLNL